MPTRLKRLSAKPSAKPPSRTAASPPSRPSCAPGDSPPSARRPLSPLLGSTAQQTGQALEAEDQHTAAAGRALRELLAAAEEKEQGPQELELQLQETRQEIQQLSQQRQGLEMPLSEARQKLASNEVRIQQLEQELGSTREANEAAEHQLSQLHNVPEHDVLRCRDLEHRGSTQASPNESHPSEACPFSPMAQRLKASIHSG